MGEKHTPRVGESSEGKLLRVFLVFFLSDVKFELEESSRN